MLAITKMSLRPLKNAVVADILNSNQGQALLLDLAYLILYALASNTYHLLFGTYYFFTGLCDGYFFGYPANHEQGLHCARYYRINNARAWKDLFDEQYWEWKTCVGHAWGRDMGFDLLGVLRASRMVELHIVRDTVRNFGCTSPDLLADFFGITVYGFCDSPETL